MDAQKPPSLSEVLRGQPIGAWVVLSPDMDMILGAAASPEGALQQANVDEESEVLGNRPVLLQVPDPTLLCFF